MTAFCLNYNDGILLASLLYSCADLSWEWDSFEQCSKPVHRWLMMSYASVIAFRGMHLVGTHMAQSLLPLTQTPGECYEDPTSSFLLDLRQKGTWPRFLTHFTWAVALPFFLLWTILGTSWMWDVFQNTPQCMPSQTHLWFAGCWLALCYVWIAVHTVLGIVAWTLECRVRRSEAELAAIEDDDVRERWGQVSHLSDFRQLEGGRTTGCGLRPLEIQSLPSEVDQGTDRECPICIASFQKGDVVRCLPDCKHVFHKSCIDLWLLRSVDCPLCKQEVRAPRVEAV